MSTVINNEDIPKTVHNILSGIQICISNALDFFSVDLNSIFPTNADDSRGPTYRHYCVSSFYVNNFLVFVTGFDYGSALEVQTIYECSIQAS